MRVYARMRLRLVRVCARKMTREGWRRSPPPFPPCFFGGYVGRYAVGEEEGSTVAASISPCPPLQMPPPPPRYEVGEGVSDEGLGTGCDVLGPAVPVNT